jgi:hypothetical protein
VEVLQELARAWHEERHKVIGSAETIMARLREIHVGQGAGAVPGEQALAAGVQQFQAMFDRRRGGFGDAPKFPRPTELLFLLREHARTGAAEPRDMVLLTLRAMALGGMRDHLGGGFHRYSVDGDWRVPHFEKMLYDQAQLVLAYVEGAQVTGQSFYADVAADTIDYVLRDMTDKDGGFHSAEDADSIPPERAGDPAAHKTEGAFYIWRDEEIGEALGDDADFFRLRFGVQPDGNAPSDPHNEFTHKNLLYRARTIEEIASMTQRPQEEIAGALARARGAMLAIRARRPRPHLDDKVLTAWNGLMIAALARASRVLPDGARYLPPARRAADFLRARLWSAGTLLRRYRNGDAAIPGYAEDYAYLIFGLLELFQAEGDPRDLEWALALQRRQDELFWDPADGGWFSTTGEDRTVLLRLKEDYDGAEPAPSSVAVLNVLTLSHLTNDPSMTEKIEKTLGRFGERLMQAGRAVPMMLAALSTYHAGMTQVVLAGPRDRDDMQALLDVARSQYRPTTLTIQVDPARHEALAAMLPWLAAMRMRDGKATAYVCRDFACQAPTSDPHVLQAAL